MDNRSAAWIVSALSLFCAAASARAAIAYTTIDDPLAGLGGTLPQDVEGSRVVGSYFDQAGAIHGFLYDGNTWTTLDHPEAVGQRGTSANGISGGLICGSFVDSAGQAHGFIYDGTTWTTLDHPPVGAGRVDTFARGISGGTVVGSYIDGVTQRGFVYRDGTFTDVIVPGATGTVAEDVDNGNIAGTYDDALGTHGFVIADGLPVVVDHPLGVPLGTFVGGIEGRRIVGSYLSLTDGSSHGFVYGLGAEYEPIDFPGATDTAVTGINGSRVVGSYVDAAGATHGFIATIPEPAGGMIAGAAAAALITRRRPRRSPAKAGSAATASAVARRGRVDG